MQPLCYCFQYNQNSYECLLLFINGLIESPLRIIKFQIQGLDFFYCHHQQVNYQVSYLMQILRDGCNG